MLLTGAFNFSASFAFITTPTNLHSHSSISTMLPLSPSFYRPIFLHPVPVPPLQDPPTSTSTANLSVFIFTSTPLCHLPPSPSLPSFIFCCTSASTPSPPLSSTAAKI
ncbi:hypothetical protein Pcinc_041218 [Petrolisthes cinctipes]|uniref:Uncharacterized protein n=1 Tax=Petrolisthes cinctipes TaxID=88211 RepID=A0AAE1BJZ7_PETCI|nr:hypothetical protein Pcinc_041218 [Petrolisthes cinctipes]